MPIVKRKRKAAKPKNEERSEISYGGWELFGIEAPDKINVSVFSGLTHTPIRRAVQLLSSYVAKLPLVVYQRDASGDTREALDHPIWWMLKAKPAPYYTPFTFFYSLMLNALWCGRGSGYAYIYRDGAGVPNELLLLDPQNVTVVRESGKVWYLTVVQAEGDTTGGELRRLPASDVLHIRSLTLDGISGLDVVRYNEKATALGLALRQHGLDFFSNGAVPGLVVERPIEAGLLSATGEEALRRRFDAIHVGIGKHHRTMILQEGTKASVLAVDAQKSQMIEQRKFDILEVANLFGVPPHKLGATDRTSYASLEQENQAFLDDGLDPWLCQIQQECSDKLLTEAERRAGMFCQYNTQALMRVNMAEKYQAFNIALQAGFMSRDEVRRLLNLNSIPNGLGEQFYMPLNMAPLGSQSAESAPPPSAPDQNPNRSFIADIADRIRRRMAKATERLMDRRQFANFISNFNEKHLTAIGSMLASLGSPKQDRETIDLTRSMRFAIVDDLKNILKTDGDFKANLAAWAAGDSIHNHLLALLGVENGTPNPSE